MATTRTRARARLLRGALLVLGLAALAAGIAWTFAPLSDRGPGLMGTPWFMLFCYPGDRGFDGGWRYALDAAMFLGVFLLTQWWFLRPRRGRRLKLAETGRPLGRAVVAAAFAAMLLSAAWLLTLLEIPDWWVPAGRFLGLWGMWAVMLGLWALWGAVFYAYWRQGDHYSRSGRMLRALLGGSVLELFVAAPVQALTARRGGCYCERGSYTGLVFGGTVLLWVFGPGVVLLFMRERYRREMLFPVCPACAYDLRSSAGPTCPECGAPIVRPDPAKPADLPAG